MEQPKNIEQLVKADNAQFVDSSFEKMGNAIDTLLKVAVTAQLHTDLQEQVWIRLNAAIKLLNDSRYLMVANDEEMKEALDNRMGKLDILDKVTFKSYKS